MIISREQTGHSLGTNLIIEAIRLSKYLFLAPSVSLRQHIANEREKAKFTHPVSHFLFTYNYCYHAECITCYHESDEIMTHLNECFLNYIML